MQKIYNPEREDWKGILKRPTQSVADVEEMVNAIFKEVQKDGDAALQKYTQKFDGVDLDELRVSKNEIVEAGDLVSKELKAAIQLAKKNIETFHKAQKTDRVEVETVSGEYRKWVFIFPVVLHPYFRRF